MTLFSTLCNESENQKFKMASYEPEIRTSQPVYNVAAQFQRQCPFLENSKNQMKLFLTVCDASTYCDVENVRNEFEIV